MTISHFSHKDGYTILDCLREVKPPFSPEATVEGFAATLKAYNVSRVTSDRWGGEFGREAFQRNNIVLEPSELTKSQLYSELLPLINSQRCRLLDNDRMINQLCNLERRVGRGTDKSSIDHPSGCHDDLSNAAAGAIVGANQRPPLKISQADYEHMIRAPLYGGVRCARSNRSR